MSGLQTAWEVLIGPLGKARRCVQRILSLAEGAAQFGERTVLQLADAFPRDAEIFRNVCQSPWLSSVEPETLRNDCHLAFVEHIEEPVHFTEQVLVA